jgi:hypothetical protein
MSTAERERVEWRLTAVLAADVHVEPALVRPARRPLCGLLRMR